MSHARILYLSLLPLLLGGLASCGGEQAPTKVALDFGTYVDNRAEDLIDTLSQLRWIKRSNLDRLVQDKGNFLLLVHGAGDECTCYTEWHEEVLAPYIKRHKLLVYAITLKEFESAEEYYGVKRISGSDTLAVFQNGALRYQNDTSDQSSTFVKKYAAFAQWMGDRIDFPKIYYVDEEILNQFYEGRDAFTIYFGRDTCPDCGYLRDNLLKPYLTSHKVVDDKFLYFDFDAFRPQRGDEDYETKMALYGEMKEKYGLAETEDNPAGMESGLFPTIYFVRPNGEDYSGEIIESAGVFFNESLENGQSAHRYFTKQRFESSSDTYLSYVQDDPKLTTKWIEGDILAEGKDRHETLKPYEEPFFQALLDYAVLDQ